MALIGKFKKPGANAAAAPAAKPAAKAAGPRKSRWDGYSGGSERTPMLDAPTAAVDYLLEIVKTELINSVNPQKPNRQTFMCLVRVVDFQGPDDATPLGEERGIICLLDNTGGQADFFRLVRAAAGYSTDEEFAEACTEAGSTTGFFLEACCGEITPFNPDGAPPIVGAKFEAKVSRGKDDGSGNYYRQYRFAPHGE